MKKKKKIKMCDICGEKPECGAFMITESAEDGRLEKQLCQACLMATAALFKD